MIQMENREYEKILKGMPLFAGLPALELERISRLVIRRKFRRGQVIIREGQPLEGFYVVLSGQVKVYKLSAGGKEQILHIIRPGESFAEAAAFTDGHSPAYAATLADSEVFFLFKDDLIRLVRDNPQLSLNMLASLSRYLHHLVTIIDELSLKEVPARLAKYLLDLLVNRTPLSREVKLPVSKKELAARLGTVSEVLSRTLNKFRTGKVIRVAGQKITVLDRSRLEQIAAGRKI